MLEEIMDDEAKELIREGLALYKRHVEAVEAYSRRYSGKAIWIWLVVLALGMPLLFLLIDFLTHKMYGVPFRM
jgi:hypothetical protein